MADKKPVVLIDGDIGLIADGDTIGVLNGGTGATTVADARTSLGLGSMSVQESSNVNITGGTISGVTVSNNVAGIRTFNYTGDILTSISGPGSRSITLTKLNGILSQVQSIVNGVTKTQILNYTGSKLTTINTTIL